MADNASMGGKPQVNLASVSFASGFASSVTEAGS